MQKFSQISHHLKKLLLVFVIWRVALFFIGYSGDQFLPYAPSFPYAEAKLASSNLPRWFYSWSNFDGVHYLTIVDNGYVGTGLIQAFFPVFPSLMWLSQLLIKPPLLTGLVLSQLLAFSFLVAWFSFLKSEYDTEIAWIGTFILLLFPSSFFLVALYSESLFLLLVVLSFWSARKKKWLLASILAGIAAGTRVVGIGLLPALLLEYWQQNTVAIKLRKTDTLKIQIQNIIKAWLSPAILKKINFSTLATLIIFSSSGLVAYMLYLAQTFGDPLYFFHVQSEFGAGRQETIILLPQVIWRYIKIFLTYRPINLHYFAFVQEFILSLVAFVGVVLSLKKVRPGLIVFSLGALLVPTFTGSLSSMPRYMLAALPFFILMATTLKKRKRLATLWFIVSSAFLIINTILFIQGYWVA